MKKYIKPIMFAVGASTITGSMVYYSFKEEIVRNNLEIYIIKLKIGNAIYVRTPEDKRILINGGYNSSIINEVGELIPFYSHRIDTVVSTSVDKNKLGGLIPVLERYPVEKVIIPKYNIYNLFIASSSDPVYRAFNDTLNNNKVKDVIEVVEGTYVDLSPSVRLETLFPLEPKKFKYNKMSDPEIFFNLSYSGKNFIYIGGASNKIQNIMGDAWLSGRSEVLISEKTDSTAITKLLASSTNPKYFIFGNNSTQSDGSQKSTKSSSKNKKKDYLSFIENQNRFNYKLNTIKIVVSKEKTSISYIDTGFLGDD